MKTPRWTIPLLAIALAGTFGACKNRGEYGSDQGTEESQPAEQPTNEKPSADTVVIEHPEGIDAHVKVDTQGNVSGGVEARDQN